jgi:hypothetical protein
MEKELENIQEDKDRRISTSCEMGSCFPVDTSNIIIGTVDNGKTFNRTYK